MPTELTKDGVDYNEDKLRYCQLIYAEARRREQDLREVNTENRLFFEGRDSVLTRRKSNSRVLRSSIFVHELTPAIDTRVGEAISRLKENQPAMVAYPLTTDPTDEQKEQASWIANTIYEQMIDCGYIPGGFREHVTAAEIQRSPAALKVSWEEKTERIPEVVKFSIPGIIGYLFGGGDRVSFRRERTGQPVTQYLWPEEFLYQPHISRFQEDSEYVLHPLWLPFQELVSRAKMLGYDLKKIHRLKEELKSVDAVGDSKEGSARDDLAREQDLPIEPGYQDGKYLIVENYILTYDEAGDEYIDLVVTYGNQEIVFERKDYYKGLRFPFVVASANPMPGTLESLSSIDLGKPLQRFHNEVYNSFVDGLTYRIFPPFKVRTGTIFKEQPIYGPGRFWQIDDLDAIKPVIENPGQLPDLTKLMDSIPEKIRNLVNAQDITQGFQAQPYEKATSTLKRAEGMARRSTPTYEAYGRTIIEVAEMFLALDQQYAENATDYVVEGGIRFDVPALTRITDPHEDKNEALMLIDTAKENPVYQSPAGLQKLRNLSEDAIRLFKQRNVDDYVPTEEETAQFLQQQAQVATEEATKEDEKFMIEQEVKAQKQQQRGQEVR